VPRPSALVRFPREKARGLSALWSPQVTSAAPWVEKGPLRCFDRTEEEAMSQIDRGATRTAPPHPPPPPPRPARATPTPAAELGVGRLHRGRLRLLQGHIIDRGAASRTGVSAVSPAATPSSPISPREPRPLWASLPAPSAAPSLAPSEPTGSSRTTPPSRPAAMAAATVGATTVGATAMGASTTPSQSAHPGTGATTAPSGCARPCRRVVTRCPVHSPAEAHPGGPPPAPGSRRPTLASLRLRSPERSGSALRRVAERSMGV